MHTLYLPKNSKLDVLQQESPQSTTQSSSSTSPNVSVVRGRSPADTKTPSISGHLDELIRQNESQRQLINELYGMFESKTNGSTNK
jgi:hypothetical protein